MKRGFRVIFVIFRKTVASLATVFVLVSLVFFALRFLPGSPVLNLMRVEGLRPEVIEYVEKRYGLNRPTLIQWGSFLKEMVRLNFGRSLKDGTPVSSLVLDRLPVSLALASVSLVCAFCASILLVFLLLRFRAVGTYRLMIVLGSVPIFVTAVFVIYVFGFRLGFFSLSPQSSFEPGKMFAACVTVVVPLSFFFLKILKSETESETKKGYVLGLRLRGLSESRIAFFHVLKNGSLAMLASTQVLFVQLVSGLVIVETIFSLPGLSKLLVDAVLFRDYPTVQGVVIVIIVLYLLSSLVVEIIEFFLNPKLRYART